MEQVPGNKDDKSIGEELVAAQAAATEGPERRRRAVLRAHAAGWTKYRIAKTLAVDEKSVRAILTAVERRAAQAAQNQDPS